MSFRAWLAACGLALALGTLIGWSARVVTTGDRYIRALAERHEAERRFWNRKAEQIINENDIERRKKEWHGKK